MKKIIVYGPGCLKCKQTQELIRRVLSENQIAADLEKVSDLKAMVAAGIMLTPAVVIDGVVKLTGRVPKAEEVKKWLVE